MSSLLVIRAAETTLGLLGVLDHVVVRGIQAKLALHLSDLLDGELGHFVGDLEGPLALNVSLGEDDIDLLQVTASSLGVEEVGEGQGSEVDQSEEEVQTPTGCSGEHGSEHDDGEVANPVHAGGSRASHGTGTEGVDLGRVDPGQRKRSKGEEDDEEEDTDDGTLGVLGTTSSQTGHGNDERETLTGETNQEQVTTANTLNHEERGQSSQSIDGSENTTQNEGQLVLKVQVVLEEQSRIVDSSVATSELLEELARATNHHTLELLGLAEGEESLPGTLVVLLGLQISLHQVDIGHNVLAIGGAVVERSQDLTGLSLATLNDEPTGRLGQTQSTTSNQNGEHDLEGDGETPGDGLVGASNVGGTEIDPVSDESTDGDNGTLKANEETTVVGVGALGLPDRNGSSVNTVTETGNDTTDHELTHTPLRAEGGSRDNGTDSHEDTTGHQKGSTTNALTIQKGEDGTEETSQLVARGDGTTEDLSMSVGADFGGFHRREFLVELITGENTRHQTLIITEEGESDN